MSPAYHIMPTDPRFEDLSDQLLGSWTVLEYAGRTGKRESYWLCRCDCGTTRKVLGYHLKSGRSTSCGCLGRQATSDRFTTHGDSGRRLYNIYHKMIRRCYTDRDSQYRNYGARGIRVAASWVSDYANFRDWALAHGYSDLLTLERNDVNGPYSPANCSWIPPGDQARNQRRTIKVTAFGVTQPLCLWAKDPRCRSSYMAARSRILAGWDPEEALTVPNRRQHKLTPSEARQVKERIDSGCHPMAISAEFRMSESAVRAIAKGLFWTDP